MEMPLPTPAIAVEGLSKTFPPDIPALDNLTLSLAPGEIFGFLGPNGSGKTTTIRLLNGALEPTAGHARIFGRSVTDDAVAIRALAGVMTETAAPYERMSGRDNLRFFGGLHSLADPVIDERSAFLLDFFDLVEAADRPVKTYSTGMRKKVCLAIAMLHRPRLLFLDEPTSGLDPEAAFQVHRLVRRLAIEEGATVFLCTHQLKYAEELCTRFGLVKQGRLLAQGTLAELRAMAGGGITLELRGADLPTDLGLEPLGDQRCRITIADDAAVAHLLTAIIQRGGRIFEVRQSQASLEDLYFTIQKTASQAKDSPRAENSLPHPA